MHRYNIILVEDDQIQVLYLESILEQYGYRFVAKFASGEEVLKEGFHPPPDIFLLDIELDGDMNGLELARELKRRYDIPIIFMTSYQDFGQEVFEQIKSFGALLQKPAQKEELVITLETTILRDRTRKENEAYSDFLFQSLRNVTEGIVIMDERYGIKFVNKRAEDILGMNQDMIQGKNASDLLRFETKANVPINFEAILNEQIIYQRGHILVRSTSNSRPIPVKPGVGRVPFANQRLFILTLYDETENLSFQEQLSTASNLLTEIFDLSPIFFSLHDIQENKILYFNHYAHNFIPNQKILEIIEDSRLVHQYIHPEDLESFRGRKLSALKEDDVLITTFRIYNQLKGNYITMELREKVFNLDEEGRPKIILSSGIDISERFELENVEQEKMLAEEKLKVREQFFASISHEIRNPLNGIVGTSDLLHQLDDLPEHIKEPVSIIRESANYLVSVLDDLLLVSKAESLSYQEREEQRIDLNTFFHGIQREYKLRFDQKRISFITENFLPVPTIIRSNKKNLQQVIYNLLNNALKFTEKGKVTMFIDINVDEFTNQAELHLKITDTGIGMSKEELSKVFDSFQQANKTIHKRFGGTGLGLSIVKKIVEDNGGTIHVESTVGLGSSFEVHMPVLLEKEKAPKREQAKAKREEDDPVLEGLHVLVVDDQKSNQIVMRMMLSQLGCKVFLAANGKEAIREYERLQPDLILMDIQMPVMDGLTATKQIRKQDPYIPIVGLSAYAMEGDAEKHMSYGLNDYLTKPITLQRLKSRLSRVIKNQLKKPDLPLFDFQKLQIELGGNSGIPDKELQEIVESVVVDLSALKKTIQAAELDTKAYGRTLHTLKGLAFTIQAPQLGRLTESIYTEYRERNLMPSSKQRIDLTDTIERTIKEIRTQSKIS